MMKKNIALFLLLVSVICKGYAPDPANVFLKNIQDKINNTFVKCCIDKNIDKLSEIESKLDKIKNNNIVLYWKAYTIYYKAIYHYIYKDKDKSKLEIERGLLVFEAIKMKSSEDYALLSYMQSFSIQYSSGIRAGFLSTNAKKNAQKAIDMDNKNLRAFLVMGAIDFYTPKQYGGGNETEKFLKKAITMKSQEVKNDYLPSWGQEESYEMLIKYYIQSKKFNLAKQCFKEAIKKYPDSYIIEKQGRYLIDK
jgi:tetratricopeptide (TPR) repeat protein